MSERRESKAAQMKKRASNVRESVGADITHPPAPATPAPRLAFGTVDQRKGYTRAKDAAAIEVGRIEPDPEQPRTEFDRGELELLADSLKRHGQLQPIRVRWDRDADVFRIIMGERRWRAAKLAGLATLACIVHEGPLTDDQVKDLQLVENCLRADLTPMERARAFKARIDRSGCSVRQLATELSLSHTSINRALALLGLPPGVQAEVEAGRLSPSAAEEIAKLPPDQRAEAAVEAVAGAKTRQQLRADRGVPHAASPPPVERGVPPETEFHPAPGITIVKSPPVERGVPGIGIGPEAQRAEAKEARKVGLKMLASQEGQGGKAKAGPHVFTIRVPMDGHAMEYRVGFARVIVVMNPDTEDAEKDAMQRALWMDSHGKGVRLTQDDGPE